MDDAAKHVGDRAGVFGGEGDGPRIGIGADRLVDIAAAGELHLTPLEYRVLDSLARRLGSIVTQAQLIREVWGPERIGDSRSLRVCIKNLRGKLEPDPKKPRHIVTEAGLGYRLRASEEQVDSI